ncbi:hypothetical protein RS9917_05330 [Synechococcus sp. RS9917]|nr:hypothetical protein RS9917_05330 [Synechococcus sp. RS9917]
MGMNIKDPQVHAMAKELQDALYDDQGLPK